MDSVFVNVLCVTVTNIETIVHLFWLTEATDQTSVVAVGFGTGFELGTSRIEVKFDAAWSKFPAAKSSTEFSNTLPAGTPSL